MSSLGCKLGRMPVIAMVFLAATIAAVCQNVSFTFIPGDPGFTCSSYCAIPDVCGANKGCEVVGAALQLIPTRTDNNTARRMAVRIMREEPVQMWDADSGSAASFHSFFVIRVVNVFGWIGDGMTFLIAPDTKVPEGSDGAGLGLLKDNSVTGAPSNGKDSRIVAVIFDTFHNTDEHPAPYVGVVINNNRPSPETDWYGIAEFLPSFGVWLDYDARSLNLEVRMLPIPMSDPYQGLSNYKRVARALKQNATWMITSQLNLTDRVAESSYIGFSASTGGHIETIELFYWELQATILASSGDEFRTQLTPRPWPSATAKLIAKVAVAASLGIALVAGALCFYFTCRRARENVIGGIEAHGAPRLFTYSELQNATNGFSQDNLLGEGGFGKVYRGLLKDGTTLVAVKRFGQSSNQGEKEFLAEVTIIGRLRHRNLVPLRGWCHNKGKRELLLVYDYMPNGSLDQRVLPPLYITNSDMEREVSSRPVLSWAERYHIIQGVAAALLYLHEDWMEIGLDHSVVHRDIKSSNVLLDAHWNARLGDFGLARLVDKNKSAQSVSTVSGTRGYLAPEVPCRRKLTVQADVYSFGIVALEVTAGRRPIDWFQPTNQRFLVEWVWSLHKSHQLEDAADPRLQGCYNTEELLLVLQLGLLCTQSEPTLRPSMREVVKYISMGVSRLIELPESHSPIPSALLLEPTISSSAVREESDRESVY